MNLGVVGPPPFGQEEVSTTTYGRFGDGGTTPMTYGVVRPPPRSQKKKSGGLAPWDCLTTPMGHEVGFGHPFQPNPNSFSFLFGTLGVVLATSSSQIPTFFLFFSFWHLGGSRTTQLEEVAETIPRPNGSARTTPKALEGGFGFSILPFGDGSALEWLEPPLQILYFFSLIFKFKFFFL